MQPRKGSAAAKTLGRLVNVPFITPRYLEGLIECSYPAANNAIEALVEKKVLREKTNQKRNRIFVAEEVLSILGHAHGVPPQEALEEAQRLLSL
ncbi:hypothetical protein ACFOY8_12370 [Thalassospira xianhensis]|uniref:Uncharacterized protein n=1 Tax=Thalassospira xianhensis MCCC 1A02616 TaxID=1177929 RepID=A0A367UEA5_9PROT|nr:hypothetical protein [Thalassospira xianhensis]RCK06341.1 hypothetical protein TH5_09070 [Thalassospira xianhensis MCCC 1A02616]